MQLGAEAWIDTPQRSLSVFKRLLLSKRNTTSRAALFKGHIDWCSRPLGSHYSAVPAELIRVGP